MLVLNVLFIGAVLTGIGIIKPTDSVSAPATTLAAADAEKHFMEGGIYKGCGDKKGCLPNSVDCYREQNCRVLATYQPAPKPFRDKYFKIELLGRISPTSLTGYVAIGFSIDKYMGADLVFACLINDLGETAIENFWNTEKHPQHSSRYKGSRYDCSTGQTSNLASCEVGVYTIPQGKFIYCTFNMKQYIELHDTIFDMRNEPFYVLRAVGFEADAQKGIKMHNEVFVMDWKQELWVIDTDFEQREFMIHSHFAWMIAIFLIFIPNGIFAARYMKESVIHYTFLGRRPYHVTHIAFMLWCFFWSSIAINEIHSYKGYGNILKPSINNEDTLWHAYIGYASIGTLQLIFFLNIVCCCCGPLRHYFFSFCHWLLGNACYFLGVYNILISHRMQQGAMPCETPLIVLACVGWTMIWHVVMMVNRTRLAKKILGFWSFRHLHPLPLKEINSDEAPELKFRLVIFAIHFFGTGFFSLALIIAHNRSEFPCKCSKFMCWHSEVPKLKYPPTG